MAENPVFMAKNSHFMAENPVFIAEKRRNGADFMAENADWPAGKTVRFRLGPAWFVFSEEELRKLLARDSGLLKIGLQRGKAVLRRRQHRARMGTAFANREDGGGLPE